MPPRPSRLAGTSPRKRIHAPVAVKTCKARKTAKTAKGSPARAEDYGVPSLERCNEVIHEYLQSLSIRKREKALISQAMFDDIWDVLQAPAAKIRTPQFRFWVRKMFKLSHTVGGDDNPHGSGDLDVVPVILHEGRPVAVKEQLHDILSFYHVASGHGGRDKTMAEIRDRYSWIPKELVTRYVKACPTCSSKRPGNFSRTSTLASMAKEKLSLVEPQTTRSSSSDHEYDALSSSSSQPLSLASSEEGFVPNFIVDPRFAPVPASAYASLFDSRILPPPVLSPVLRSPPLGSPNLSADPRKWLADLAMQPGPHYAGPSQQLSPLLTDLRRVGSEGDAGPAHGHMPLPPLMKALSEGMGDERLYRAPFNVPPGFQIPRRDSLTNAYSSDIVLSSSTGGLQYPPSDSEDNANIDPVLLGVQPVVETYEDYRSTQQGPSSYHFYPPTVGLQDARFMPTEHDYRTTAMMRSISDESMSSEGSMRSLGSVASVGRAGSEEEGSMKGVKQSSSSDPQDWESSYCLDEI